MKKWEKNLIAYRRLFHQYPETGWNTFFSTAYIGRRLEEAGYQVYVGREVLGDQPLMDEPNQAQIIAAEEIARERLKQEWSEDELQSWFDRMGGRTGIVAVWDTHRQGPVKAFRFDMDALAVTETDQEAHFPNKLGFSSKIPGCFHACGHDGHMALGLTLAEAIAEEAGLTGSYIFIFQPAEEGVRGAMAFCRQWKYGDIQELYCGHIGFAPENTLVTGAEGFLATTKFDVTFHGKSAHAGLCPERGRNALLAAAKAVMQMQEIPRPETGVTRLNVGQIRAGESRNTIPATAWIQVETRGETHSLNQYMKQQALNCIRQACDDYGVTCEVQYQGESVSASSDVGLAQKVLKLAENLGEFDTYELTQNFGASDDGAVFMDMVKQQGGKAVYLLYGTHTVGMHHEANFDYDESVLSKAMHVLMDCTRL